MTGRSLVRRSPKERGVSECDLETSVLGRSRSTTAFEPRNGNVASEEINADVGYFLNNFHVLMFGNILHK